MSARSTIICVDDDKLILLTLAEQLNEWMGRNYTVEKALSGHEALDIIDDCMAERTDISLVISDYLMPVMKGDEFLEQVKLKTPSTRRIMLTGYSAIEGVANAINKAGIYRYLSKPWDAKDMMLTVLQAVRSFEQDQHTERLNERNKVLCGTLEKIVDAQKVKLNQTVNALTIAVELREGGVTGHAARVAGYAERLAEKMNMSADNIAVLKTAALLHGVGKLCLSDDELGAVKGIKSYNSGKTALKQAEQAREIIGHMEKGVVEGIIYHTERADGTGAFGLDGSKIPIHAKIIALCDYYDMLRTAAGNVAHRDILQAMEAYKDKIFDAALYDVLLNTDMNA